MTDDATIDEQVRRALVEYRKVIDKNYTTTDWTDDFRQIARDLLAGKFREAPLPQIVPPPWPHRPPNFVSTGDGWRVYCTADDSKGYHGELLGPIKPMQRDAIEAWNAVFTRKDER